MKLETIDDSHIILKMEINGGVGTLPIYWKLHKDTTKFMFYGSVIKTTNSIYGIQHHNM
jgi:hypothetical protein